MVAQNKKEFDICGITRWHDLGYRGQGMSIAEMEPFAVMLPIWKGVAYDPFDNKPHASDTGHGYQVAQVMSQVCPEAKLYTIPGFSGTFTSKTATGFWVEQVLPFLRNNIDVLGVSLSVEDEMSLGLQTRIKGIHDHTIFVFAAGNDSTDSFNGYPANNTGFAIGAVHYNERLDKIERAGYSSVGKELDFVSFSNLWVTSPNGKNIYPVTGTSFAQPMFSGMCLLVQQFFKEKAGRKLTQDEMCQFVKDHCKDLGAAGFDEYHGYGLFVLPDPSTIDIKKYVGGDVMFEIIPIEELLKRLDEHSHKELHVHHTWKPVKSDYNGKNAITLQEGMRNYHMKEKGWLDIGQHITLLPDGLFVTGRDFRLMPASITGYNAGAFAVEMLGNFDIEGQGAVNDKGYDVLEGAQRKAILQLAKYFVDKGRYVRFHRENSDKTCPGTSIDKTQFMKEVADLDKPYKDFDTVADWAKPYVVKAKELGLMVGDTSGNFNPNAFLTRQEAAKLIVLLAEKK